jgi:hypothetical protein
LLQEKTIESEETKNKNNSEKKSDQTTWSHIKIHKTTRQWGQAAPITVSIKLQAPDKIRPIS